MATTSQLPAPPASAVYRLNNPLALWHLLSLDAPTVAVLWTWTIAAANHIRLPWQELLAMGIAVWLLYASDRLLDARLREDRQDLEARHHFHYLHRRAFRAGILSASIALATLLPKLAPEATHLYLVLGGLVFGYFIAIHAVTGYTTDRYPTVSHRLPKEIAVGVFFSAAVFIPTVARQPALRIALLPGAALFAALCSLNCLFIYAWEHPVPPQSGMLPIEPHPATRYALSYLPALTIAAALASGLLAIADHLVPWPITAACCTAALLLLVLDRNRYRLRPTTLRAMADLCLLTPMLLLPFVV